MLCFPGVIIVLLSIYWNNLFLIQLFIYQLTVSFIWPSLSGAGSYYCCFFLETPLSQHFPSSAHNQTVFYSLHGAILCYLRLTGILGGKGMEQDCQGTGLLHKEFGFHYLIEVMRWSLFERVIAPEEPRVKDTVYPEVQLIAASHSSLELLSTHTLRLQKQWLGIITQMLAPDLTLRHL